ncbi:glycoside hydrolase family 24 protein [Halomonas halmophila]|uniref:Lysozyme n=1 Tax=Halomonas halmophila TaxID=252 RepID=A0A4Y4EWG0_9GAMM|nr:glycoside hydrolase family 104 protein [Halomonas halmophila]GED21527.1 lysozyme [Halomonas halmophila]
MPRIEARAAGGRNVCAFLDMLAYAEIGEAMLALSDDGYDVLVGSLPGAMETFSSYAEHPLAEAEAIEYAPGLWSTAAGRYQILARYWQHYQPLLALPDFRPESQDRYALQQLREQRALPLIQSGRLRRAIAACANIWASLPGAGYGQHEVAFEELMAVYQQAGGRLASRDHHWFEAVMRAGGAPHE